MMLTLAPSKVSAEDLRAAIARSGIPGYVIGGRARVNPIKLSRILHGHVRITDNLASRILLAVEQEVAAHGALSPYHTGPLTEAHDPTAQGAER